MALADSSLFWHVWRASGSTPQAMLALESMTYSQLYKLSLALQWDNQFRNPIKASDDGIPVPQSHINFVKKLKAGKYR